MIFDEILDNWHKIINQYHSNRDEGENFQHWMYEAKSTYSELPRLKRLFEAERTGDLPKIHKQCSLSKSEEVIDNHLTCCLGIDCRGCKFLKAIENIEAPPERIDEIKAYTCTVHILQESARRGIDTSEGYILRTDDRMYWDNVYKSMAVADSASFIQTGDAVLSATGDTSKQEGHPGMSDAAGNKLPDYIYYCPNCDLLWRKEIKSELPKCPNCKINMKCGHYYNEEPKELRRLISRCENKGKRSGCG